MLSGEQLIPIYTSLGWIVRGSNHNLQHLGRSR